MKHLNFLLNGFGFETTAEFKTSSFGYMNSELLLKVIAMLAVFTNSLNSIFGLDVFFLAAYAILISFEWFTGVLASRDRGEKHESRKLGRMLLKIAVYSVPLYILNTFQTRAQFPVVFGFEIDPFIWLYWIVLMMIIWQLMVSLLENLDQLKFKWARKALIVINNKFYKQLDLTEDDFNNRPK